jgi:hypothetical protein
MSIQITWSGETLTMDRDEAKGFAEALESEGEAFEWVDLDPPKSVKLTPSGIDWTGEGRDRKRRAGVDRLTAESETRKAAAAAKAALDARAAEMDLPAWVIHAREQLTKAREWGKDPMRAGQIRARRDGTWYLLDALGATKELPWDAGKYFDKDQATA